MPNVKGWGFYRVETSFFHEPAERLCLREVWMVRCEVGVSLSWAEMSFPILGACDLDKEGSFFESIYFEEVRNSKSAPGLRSQHSMDLSKT